MKKHLKTISIFLIVVMFFTLAPLQAFAQEINSLNEIDAPTVKDIKKPEPKILTELTDKRGKNVKHFLLSNKKYEAAVYPVAVHYMSNGKWKDIDNTLEDATDEDNNAVLENKDNEYKVKIAKNAKSSKIVKIQKDKYELSWNIKNINDSKANISSFDANQLNNLSDNDKKITLTKLSSTVNFPNIFNGIDLQYRINPEEVKENIIINQRTDISEYKFYIKTKNLAAKIEDDKSIIFYDINDTSKKVFKINSPIMYDTKGEQSSAIQVNLEETKDGYTLTLIPDSNWLNSPDRAYPVTIDPQVSTSLDSTDIYDAHVSSNLPSNNFQTSYILKTGVGSTSGINRTYIKFNLPDLTSSDLITNAYFYAIAINHSGSSASQVNAHEVTSNWDSSTINWNNKPSYNTKIEDYKLVQSSAWYQWDITNIAKKWYSTGNNYGLMLKDLNETTNYDEYYSSDTGTESYRPQVVLYYVNNSGLESYWSYHSQDVMRAGTGYINDYNGNLVFVHDDINMNGNLMPVDIKHVFNSNTKDTSVGYGLGWRLNIYQELAFVTIDGVQQYIYTDEDGTKHYFLYDSSSGLYKDQSGIDLTLKKNADNTYTITDKKDNKLNFTSSGYLYSIVDSNGNTATLTYTNGKITKVTDGAGRVTTLDVNGSNVLLGIIDPAGRRISFGYTGNLLTRITYPDGNYTTFNYDVNNNLTSVTNYDGYKIVYSYYGVKPYRISRVQETHTNGTTGGSLDISYGFNTTTFTDAKGRKNVYQFNDYGNTVSIKDDDGSAQYYKYLSDSNGNTLNKLTNDSKLQKTIVNYIQNHNIESSGYWDTGYWTGSTGTLNFTTEAKYLGNQSLKVSKTNAISRHFYGQTLTLEKGKTYTLSGYIKTSSISNTNGKGAALFVNYQNASGAWETVNSKYINGTNDWERYELSFTLPADAASTTVYARAGIVEETGTAYFDCLQLENGSIANRYNLVENADFKYGSGTPTFWTKNSYTDANDTLVSAIQNDPGVPGIDRSAFKISGASNKTKALYQVINVSGTSSDVFSVGGWARGDSVPLSSGRYFALDIGFQKPDGTFDWHVVPFNEDSSGWQYVSDRVAPDPSKVTTYNAIYIYVIYYNNENTVYFDGIQLYKEEFSQSYAYDSKGNLTSTVDLAKQNSTFEYNGTNDLIKAIDPKGNNFNYTYDTHHNMLTATSAENVLYTFTYDSKGNPLTAKVGDSTLFINSTAEYSSTGNYIKSLTDLSGNKVNFNYNETKGTLDSVTDAKGNTTSYVYDSNLDRLTGVSKTVDGEAVTNSYSYENDRIKTITHNGFSYSFNYDSLGNMISTSVAGNTLITNTYDNQTGNFLSSKYGNDSPSNPQVVSFDYDNLDRVISKKFNGNPRFNYGYDYSGNLGYEEDLVNGVNYRYVYDIANRLAKVVDSNGNVISFGYDLNNNVSSFSDKVNGIAYTTGYVYDKDNRQTGVNIHNGNSVSYSYDPIGRLISSTLRLGSNQYVTSYDYESGANGSTTTKLKTITNNGNVISYTYDANGNIDTITQDGKVIKYYYNEIDELIREDNGVLNKTIVYSYDAGGNILSKVEYPYTEGTPSNPTKTITYSYDDANWKDKLTSFDGKTITYDEIGNPLSYNGTTFIWEEGRQLKSISKDGQAIKYKYNSDGIRTEKTVNGVVTKYHLVGDKVTFETNGTDIIYYTYNSNDNLVSMNLNGVEYYYIRNGQGDIIGLVDGQGNGVVTYTYDSWGNIVSIDGSLKDTVGVKNPYRYRGYRYDTETELYYLNSRYYNPEWGRFINADGIGGEVGTLLSHNMFAYCFNNPVNLEDPSGNWPTLGQIFKAAATVAVTAIVVTAVILAAPAVAGAAGIAAGMTLGAGTMAAASTIASVATIGIGVGIGVFGVNRAVEAVTGTNYVAKTVFGGNKAAYNATEAAFNIAGAGMLGVAANNNYTRTEAPAIFKGNGGWGFKPSKNIQALYSNPNADGGPGGTFIAYNNKLSGTKWRIDWDPAHGMHGHWGAGKAAFTAHRGIWPWNFGQNLDE